MVLRDMSSDRRILVIIVWFAAHLFISPQSCEASRQRCLPLYDLFFEKGSEVSTEAMYDRILNDHGTIQAICIDHHHLNHAEEKIHVFNKACEAVRAERIRDSAISKGDLCKGTYARRLVNNFGESGEWKPIQAVLNATYAMDPEKYPVVLLAIDSIACETGCCTTEVFVRPGTSDVKVLEQIFVRQEYKFLYDLKWSPKTLLDAGANIGLASVVFANLFPEAKIVAVEPDPSNFAVLQLNTARYGNILLEKSGLWDKLTGLNVLKDDYLGEWGIRVEEVPLREKADLRATSISRLLEKHNYTGFDYAKIDIEGAEGKVFGDSYTNNKDWLLESKLLSIEIHGDDARAIVEGAVEGIGDRAQHYTAGEYDVWQLKD